MKKKNSGIIVFSDLPLSYASAANWWMFLLTVICGICSIVQVYAVSGFVDVALQMAQHTHLSGHLLTNLFILMSTVAVDWLTPRIQGILRQKSELELLRKYRPILLEKCARLEYTHIECAESHDLINRILDGTERKWMNIYQAMLDLLKLLISIVGILLVIACYVWWAAILILIFCIPLFLYSIKSGKKNYQAQRDTSYYVRKYQYLEQVLNERESLNERKLFGFSDEINKKYADTYKEAFLIETGTQIHWALKTKISGGVSSVAALLIVITLIQPTLAGNISIGLFISLVNAVFLLTSQMSWGLSRNIDALVNGNEFCKDMRTFWHLSEDEGVLELPLYVENIEKIEFRNVSFRYQGADFDVLKNVSFIMRKGKNYALVGANGAGKTTVIKLLTGLYTDYKGEILINGKELRKYTSAEQKGMFSVVYQDFVQHSLTFRENCEIGDLCHAISESQIGELFEQFKLMELTRRKQQT